MCTRRTTHQKVSETQGRLTISNGWFFLKGGEGRVALECAC
jgi:hypothetical protein